MKVKIFALVAAFFMLMGGSAWAQSEVKGDVNKDGVVNEQDIAAILAIMAKNNGVAEKTKYYWYLGWDNEDWYTNTNLVTSTNGWNETTTNAMPTTYNRTNGRNRQTPWGGCTDANPKLLLNDTCLPPKLVPLHYES